MPHGVIHKLEVVEINEDHSKVLAASQHPADSLFKLIGQRRAIGQIREGIKVGLMEKFFFPLRIRKTNSNAVGIAHGEFSRFSIHLLR